MRTKADLDSGIVHWIVFDRTSGGARSRTEHSKNQRRHLRLRRDQLQFQLRHVITKKVVVLHRQRS